MSDNWVRDIDEMHTKFGTRNAVQAMDPTKLKAFLEFRIKFLEEELNEIKNAESPEDVLDGIVDLCVVAIGTMDAFGVDAAEAWNRVHDANMTKVVGVKPNRPNPLGLPDLIKPKLETHGYDWVAPVHADLVTRQLMRAFE